MVLGVPYQGASAKGLPCRQAARFPGVMTLRAHRFVATALLLAGTAACSPGPMGDAANAEIWLNSSEPAVQLREHLPISLLFNDRMGTGEIAQLSAEILVDGADPVSSYRVGDVAYWAPGESIVVFLSDGDSLAEEGLVLVGHVTSGLNDLASCTRNCAVNLHESMGETNERMVEP